MSRIVELDDEGPLVIQEDDVEDGAVAVCRCGVSGKWPYCDGSHAEVQDEAEGEIYRYGRTNGDVERETVKAIDGADPRS